MPILLKNLLKEGVTVKILGSNSRGYGLWNDIDTVAKWLHVNVIVPIEKTLSTTELQSVATKPIQANYNSLYVYVDTYPKKVAAQILGGIAHFFENAGVKTDKWYRDPGAPFRTIIPLIKTGANDAPSISMSGGELEKIKYLLDLMDKFDGPGGSLTLSIDVATLKHHLGNYYDNLEQSLVPPPPTHNIRKCLQTLQHMVAWAESHGYKTITAD